MSTGPLDTPGIPFPPWIAGAVTALLTASVAWGGIGARITNLENSNVRIESKVDALLLKLGK